jgi:hypothetical protein
MHPMTTKAPETTTEFVQLPQFDLRDTTIRLRGTSPLICHRWSEKAIKIMLDKQMGKASTGKARKDPQADYEGSLYPFKAGYGFPTIAFKAAAVTAGKYAEAKMTFLRGAFHIDGELVEIKGKPRPREDMVRVGMGTADIRYRAEFPEWEVALPIRYNAKAINIEQLANLFRIAGFGVGIGEWRPEKDGQFGRFEVV